VHNVRANKVNGYTSGGQLVGQEVSQSEQLQSLRFGIRKTIIPESHKIGISLMLLNNGDFKKFNYKARDFCA
jgi:hypothetical protein